MKNILQIKNNVPIRLNRSELAVPGSRVEIFEKAARNHRRGENHSVSLDAVLLKTIRQGQLERETNPLPRIRNSQRHQNTEHMEDVPVR